MPLAQTKRSASQSKREARAKAKAVADRNHDRYVQRTYGLEPGQYQAMLEQQDGRCAICMKRAITRRLAVDHDHYTGKPRGVLLCYRCNQYLGQFEFEPIILHNLILYALGILADFGLQGPGLPEALPVASERPTLVPIKVNRWRPA